MKNVSVITIMLLSMLLTACSGNDEHLITTEEEMAVMGEAFKISLSKNVYKGMPKEEMCATLSDALSEGLNASGSSFAAMNTWIRGYKEPSLALYEQTYTAQVAQFTLAMIQSTKCEEKKLTGDVLKFIDYIYVQAKKDKKQKDDEKKLQAANEAKFGPELEKIMVEMKELKKIDCISSNAYVNYDSITYDGIDEQLLTLYRKKLSGARKCREGYLIKQKDKEAVEKAKAAEEKIDRDAEIATTLKALNEAHEEKEAIEKVKAAEEKAVRDAKIAATLKTLNEARGKIQVLNQSCVKSDFMLNMFQTSEYEREKKNVMGGYGSVETYARAVNQHLKNSKCKPL